MMQTKSTVLCAMCVCTCGSLFSSVVLFVILVCVYIHQKTLNTNSVAKISTTSYYVWSGV